MLDYPAIDTILPFSRAMNSMGQGLYQEPFPQVQHRWWLLTCDGVPQNQWNFEGRVPDWNQHVQTCWSALRLLEAENEIYIYISLCMHPLAKLYLYDYILYHRITCKVLAVRTVHLSISVVLTLITVLVLSFGYYPNWGYEIQILLTHIHSSQLT